MNDHDATEVPQSVDKAVLAALAAVRGHLEYLAQIGNEPWRSSAHPMNQWVSKENVNSTAKDALVLLDEIVRKEKP